MDERLTLRDLIVFFISGFLFTAIFIITYYDILLEHYEQINTSDSHSFLKKIDGTLILAAGIPSLYVIGHFVHAIDSVIFSNLGLVFQRLYKKHPNFFTKSIHRLFNGHRIRGIIDDYWTINEDLLVADAKCVNQPTLYNEARYWSFLNDTLKAYVLVFLVFVIVAFARDKLLMGVVYLLFLILFRYRGRLFGIYYVQSISRIYTLNALNKS